MKKASKWFLSILIIALVATSATGWFFYVNQKEELATITEKYNQALAEKDNMVLATYPEISNKNPESTEEYKTALLELNCNTYGIRFEKSDFNTKLFRTRGYVGELNRSVQDLLGSATEIPDYVCYKIAYIKESDGDLQIYFVVNNDIYFANLSELCDKPGKSVNVYFVEAF